MPTAVELKDGQIYRWRWTDDERAKFGAHDPYWCKSCIAIVRGGRLLDTYWSDMSSDRAIDPAQVELTLIGDEKWPKVSEAEALRYDRKDLCDMRHANSSRAPIYVRPGAQLNKAAMLAVLDDREEDARSTIRTAEWRLEEIAKQRALLEADKLDEVHL